MKHSNTGESGEQSVPVTFSRRTALRLAAIAAGALLLPGCADATIVPTQKNLTSEYYGNPVEVDGKSLQLVQQGVKIRVARYSAVFSHQGGVDERVLVVNGYTIDGNSQALVYEVLEEDLLPGEESLFDYGVWTKDIITNAIQQDPSIAQPNGDTLKMTGTVYRTYADGENANIIENPSGPLVFIAVSTTTAKA